LIHASCAKPRSKAASFAHQWIRSLKRSRSNTDCTLNLAIR
jgi:hypothetical protein